MSATTTRAPSWANNSAVAWPNPEAAPVTIATFPFNLISAPLHVRTAIRAENLPGDESGLFRSQIGHRIGNILGFAQLTHGDSFHHALNPTFRALPHHRCVDHPGGHGIDGDPGAGQLTGHGDRQPGDASLSRAVMHQAPPAGQRPHRGGTDEPAPVARTHPGKHRTETVVRTVQVYVEHPVPLFLG